MSLMAASLAGASSVDSAGEVAASIDQRAGNLVFHLDGTYRRAEDYNIPVEGESRAQLAEEGEDVPDDFDENRTLENSFAETSSLTGGVSYVGDRGFFGVAVNNFNSTYGIPGGHGHEEEEGEEHEGEEEEHDEEEEEEGDVFIELDQTRVDVNAAVPYPNNRRVYVPRI